MFPKTDSWIALEQRLPHFKVLKDVTDAQRRESITKPTPLQDIVVLRVDMRDGHCFVSQAARPNGSDLVNFLTVNRLTLVQEAMQRLLEIEELATQFMRGKENPWMWTRNIRCKYINVEVDPINNIILCVRDNFGKFITMEDLRGQCG